MPAPEALYTLDALVLDQPPLPDPTPYESGQEQIEAYFERARLLLLRHLVSHWYRVTDSAGQLNDLFVSFQEVAMSLSNKRATILPSLDERLAQHETWMSKRLQLSVNRDVTFPVEELRAAFDLVQIDVDLLLVLAGMQLDLGLHRLAKFVWANFSASHPTVGFLAEVVGRERARRRQVYQCFDEGSPLVRFRLFETIGATAAGPTLLQQVRLPRRLEAFLLRHDGDLQRRVAAVVPGGSHRHLGQAETLRDDFLKAIRLAQRQAEGFKASPFCQPLSQTPIVIVHGQEGLNEIGFAATCLEGANRLVAIELAILRGPQETPLQQAALEAELRVGLREAHLQQAVPMIVARNLRGDEQRCDALLKALLNVLTGYRRLVLLGLHEVPAAIIQRIGPRPTVRLTFPDATTRLALWREAMLDQTSKQPELEGMLSDIADRFTLAPQTIYEAADQASVWAAMRAGSPRKASVCAEDLQRAVTLQLSHQLGTLAVPLTTTMTWKDVVLDEDLTERIEELVAQSREEKTVYAKWGFGRLLGYGAGLTALFAGPPGTGKTMMAALIGQRLGREVFQIDLSRVVDKYIGETEKNLAKVFDEAERSQAVLLFDEADSLFSKRSKVVSSNDRYANLEVNFLLQRMEHFRGISILTTNRASNMDEAFIRRLKFRLNFGLPTVEDRELLWKKMLPKRAPVSGPIEWRGLAEDFEMAPAHIKNSVVRAAFQAARNKTSINHEALYEAASVEYREMGYLVCEEQN